MVDLSVDQMAEKKVGLKVGLTDKLKVDSMVEMTVGP